MCKLLNSIAIASGYAGRDPQGGTSDGSFFSKFSFRLQSMVKVLLQFFKRIKENFELKLNQEEDGRLRRWKNEKQIIYKEVEKSDKDGWSL